MSPNPEGMLPDDLPPESRVSFPGPFKHHDVVVNGWRVPLLQAHVHDAGQLTVVLDDRFGLELSVAEAERVIPFVADAIAVALGFGAHPAEDSEWPLPRSPHPKPKRAVSLAGFGCGDDGP